MNIANKLTLLTGRVGAVVIVFVLLAWSIEDASGQNYIGPNGGRFEDNANWDNQEVPNSAASNVVISGRRVVKRETTLAASLNVNGGGQLDMIGNPGNGVPGSGQSASIIFDGLGAAITMSGGSIRMQQFSNFRFDERLNINGGLIETLDSSVDITGNGTESILSINNSIINGSATISNTVLNNNGTLLGNDPGGLITGFFSGSSNSGVIQAIASGDQRGRLVLGRSGTGDPSLDNTDGLLSANGGELFVNRFEVNGGMAESINGGLFRLQSGRLDNIHVGGTTAETEGGIVQLESNGTLLSAEIEAGGTLVGDRGDLSGNGTFTNNGNIVIRDGLEIEGRVTVGGNGTLTFENDNGTIESERSDNVQDTLVNTNQNLRVRGEGIITRIDVDNDGQILAEGDLRMVAGGGQMNLDNTDGVIGALDGGTLTIAQGGAVVEGGTIVTEGTGEVIIGNFATLKNVTNEGQMSKNAGGSLFNLGGTVTNNGTIDVGSAGFRALDDNLQLQGNGQVNLSNNVQISGDFVNGAEHTIQGDGRIRNFDTVVNQGTLGAGDGETLAIEANSNDTFTNEGTLLVESGGRMNVLVSSGAANRQRFTNLSEDNTVLTDGVYQVNNGRLAFLGSNVELETNRADIIMSGPDAQITASGNANILSMLSLNEGSLQLLEEFAMEVDSDLTNSGALEIGTGSALTVGEGGTGTYFQIDGTTIVDGTLIAANIEVQGGMLQGLGQLPTLTNGGLLAPGASPGTLEIAGDFEQLDSGILEIELGGVLEGIEIDLLDVDGTATLTGTLNILRFGDFFPTIGQTASILFADEVIGEFGTLLFEGQDATDFYAIAYLEDRVEVTFLEAAAIPEPSTVVMLGIGGVVIGLALLRRGRRTAIAA